MKGKTAHKGVAGPECRAHKVEELASKGRCLWKGVREAGRIHLTFILPHIHCMHFPGWCRKQQQTTVSRAPYAGAHKAGVKRRNPPHPLRPNKGAGLSAGTTGVDCLQD